MKNIFLLGAAGYPLLELLYRGRTHYSMAIAGGVSAMLIEKLRSSRCPLPVRAVLCGAGITGVEYLCGLIWNRRFSVWDYRNMPLNVKGQICLPFTLTWCVLSGAMMVLLDRIEN